MTKIYDLQAKYENYVRLTTKRQTAIRYAKALESFFRRHREKTDPEDFSRLDVQDYQIMRKREGASSRTINFEITVLKSFWNWMIRMEAAPYNPVTVKRLKEVQVPREVLTEEEQLRVFETARILGEGFYRLALLAFGTGLRAETLAAIERSDVDFENGLLIVPGEKMKAGRNQTIPLGEHVLEVLRPLPEGRIFDGFARDAKGLSYRFNRILRRAGVKLRGLRLGRRTFATTLLRRGADIKVVQDLLGHKSIKTTSLYIASSEDAQTKAAIELLPKPPGCNPSL